MYLITYIILFPWIEYGLKSADSQFQLSRGGRRDFCSPTMLIVYAGRVGASQAIYLVRSADRVKAEYYWSIKLLTYSPHSFDLVYKS